jgi:hypothetical protein
LTYKGKPLDDTQKFRVAINNYRYAGGGRYNVYKGLPVVYRSPQEVRELITEYLQRTGVVPTTANNNWHIEPQEAVDALRKLALDQRGRPATAQTLSPETLSGATNASSLAAKWLGDFGPLWARLPSHSDTIAGN